MTTDNYRQTGEEEQMNHAVVALMTSNCYTWEEPLLENITYIAPFLLFLPVY